VLGGASQLAALVLGRLLVSADAKIERRSPGFCHDHLGLDRQMLIPAYAKSNTLLHRKSIIFKGAEIQGLESLFSDGFSA
jgi:hypothetical protein